MAKITINKDIEKSKRNKISRHIYGHFAEHLGRCIYDGFWVGEGSPIPNTRGIRKDIVEALKKIKTPNLRWPGGCFADEYHWKDGIGPRESRPTTINTHWGGVLENNHFGTHEFFDLCKQLGCEPYICGNVGSGTIQEMAKWVEYITFHGKSTMADLRRKNGREDPWKIKYWAIGNENWGCGGNMTAEYYADLYCRYSTYCRDYSGNKLYKVACGPVGEYPLEWVLDWVDVLMKKTLSKLGFGSMIHGLALHYYTRAGIGASATKFNENKWLLTMEKALYMEELIIKISEIMEKYDPNKNIDLIIDEWGTWWRVEKGTKPGFLYQQNTMRDALVASLSLDIFNRHCDRVHMANIAQTVNVLQAMVLTKDEEMIFTPTYHVFEMYKVHQEASLLPMNIKSEIYKHELPSIHASASLDDNGKSHISLCNIDPNNEIGVLIEFSQTDLEHKNCKARILRGDQMNSHNTFESPEIIKPVEFNSANFNVGKNQINFKMPSMAIMVIEID
jgi:alpha-N-arabinofuranosidase